MSSSQTTNERCSIEIVKKFVISDKPRRVYNPPRPYCGWLGFSRDVYIHVCYMQVHFDAFVCMSWQEVSISSVVFCNEYVSSVNILSSNHLPWKNKWRENNFPMLTTCSFMLTLFGMMLWQTSGNLSSSWKNVTR